MRIGVKPQGDQVNLYKKNKRFLAAAIGRQYGKSTICTLRLFKRATQKRGLYYWVSPVVTQAREQLTRALIAYKPLIRDVNRSFMEVSLVNGSRIAYRGSDRPDSLPGATLDGVVVDEAGIVKNSLWPQVIRPMLAVKNGFADIIGTPRGRNWFHDIYHRGGEDWDTHHASSNASPFFPETEFEAVRKGTPERIFRQEYLAEFLDQSGEVFRGIQECIAGELEDPDLLKKHYIMGVDLAKHEDFTVITIMDIERNHLVYFERFNQIEWPIQKRRIYKAARRYNAKIILDATGVGDPIYDDLKRAGLHVQPVKFTNQIKQHLIENLQMLIELRKITFPHVPDLINELQLFAMDKTPGGLTKYSAPPGYHDDCVISLALACRDLGRGSTVVGNFAWA